MANNLTNFAESLLLNILFRNNSGSGAYTPPTTIYLGLLTAAAGEATAGTEVSTSGTAYARQAIAFGAPADVSGFQTIANTGAINFPTATGGGYGTVTDIGLYDASTAGNLLAYGAMAASKTVNAGDSISFAIGSVTLGLN